MSETPLTMHPFESAIVRTLEADNARLTAEVEQNAIDLEEYRRDVERLRAGIERLVKQNNVLVRKCDPFLSSADLKAIDKHCDWVAFGHAYRAMLNVRAALSGDKKAEAESERLRAALLVARKYVLVQSCELSLQPEDAARDLDVIDEALEEDDNG